eukprot:703751-Prymnesium_polylepis.1
MGHHRPPVVLEYMCDVAYGMPEMPAQAKERPESDDESDDDDSEENEEDQLKIRQAYALAYARREAKRQQA